MTVSELYNSVAQLGFETSLEDDARFYFAANRALLQVNAIRPAVKSYVINHKPLTNMLSDSAFTPIEKVDELVFEGKDAKAYYFEADGNGTALIELFDEQLKKWRGISTETLIKGPGFTAYYGFFKDGKDNVSGRVRLRFTGEYLYSVKNVALYKHVYSGNEEDIPAYEPFTRYDMSVLAPDFLALDSPCVSLENSTVELRSGEWGVENERIILLPYDAKGVYKVQYKRKPQELDVTDSPDTDDTKLELDEDLAALLPLLVASYVWVDDEPEKAQYYGALYKENAIEIERRHRIHKPAVYEDVTGW